METVPFSSIKVNSEYLRVDTDVSTLMKSIKQIGLINPLTVNEQNELIAGGRRYTALRALGVDDVPVNRIAQEEALEHELISIDENLIRKPLSKVELETCLNRGREIYELLNPEANRVEIEQRDLSSSEKKAEKERDEQDETSFAAVTAEKTGLSKSSIRTAIKREVLSADGVKEARANGEINASQANEIIRLEKDVQEKVLPLVAGATTREVRALVNQVKHDGFEAAIAQAETIERVPKELAKARSQAKTVSRNLNKMLDAGMRYHGPERVKIQQELEALSRVVQATIAALSEEAQPGEADDDEPAGELAVGFGMPDADEALPPQ